MTAALWTLTHIAALALGFVVGNRVTLSAVRRQLAKTYASVSEPRVVADVLKRERARGKRR